MYDRLQTQDPRNRCQVCHDAMHESDRGLVYNFNNKGIRKRRTYSGTTFGMSFRILGFCASSGWINGSDGDKVMHACCVIS
jgi:hypothetical protein